MEENFKKQEIMNVVEKECEAIAKFIKEKVKLRPTLVMYKVPLGKGEKDVDMPVDYCLGKDVHFTVLSHKKEILALAKELDKHANFNGLKSIEDSMRLLA
jgi:hypothetical protein